MTIARLIEGRSGDVWCCAPTHNVREAVAMLASHRIGALPVVEDGQVVGIFSERDVVNRLAELGPTLLDSSVGSIMTAPAVTVDATLGIMDALGLMTERRSTLAAPPRYR